MLTGHALFAEGTVAEILMKHQTVDPPPVHSERLEVPPGISAVIQKMMAKRPEDRFQPDSEVAAALPAPLAIPVADSTLNNGLMQRWTTRLRFFASPKR